MHDYNKESKNCDVKHYFLFLFPLQIAEAYFQEEECILSLIKINSAPFCKKVKWHHNKNLKGKQTSMVHRL